MTDLYHFSPDQWEMEIISALREIFQYSLLSPSGDLGTGLVWHNVSGPHFSVRLFKSSSNWTKLSMMGLQLFSGLYQMTLDVFWCSQLFSNVFSWAVIFMHYHPLCGHFFSAWCRMVSDVPKMFSDVLSCFQMFSGCPQLITDIL